MGLEREGEKRRNHRMNSLSCQQGKTEGFTRMKETWIMEGKKDCGGLKEGGEDEKAPYCEGEKTPLCPSKVQGKPPFRKKKKKPSVSI